MEVELSNSAQAPWWGTFVNRNASRHPELGIPWCLAAFPKVFQLGQADPQYYPRTCPLCLKELEELEAVVSLQRPKYLQSHPVHKKFVDLHFKSMPKIWTFLVLHLEQEYYLSQYSQNQLKTLNSASLFSSVVQCMINVSYATRLLSLPSAI